MISLEVSGKMPFRDCLTFSIKPHEFVITLIILRIIKYTEKRMHKLKRTKLSTGSERNNLICFTMCI